MSLLEKYIIARWCYAIGEDYIDDIEYRQIDEKLKEEIPDNEYVKRSWSDDPCPIELLEKYNLMYLYRDIKFEHKSESIRSINSDKEFEDQFRNLDEESRLSFKLDGFNIQVNYYNGRVISAETRGRSGNSLNANVVAKIVPQTIPYKGKVKVTGETVIPNSKWEMFKLETGNTSQRNSVSTALAREMIDSIKFVAFNIQTDKGPIGGDIYEVLQNCGFNVPTHKKVSNYKQLLAAMKYFERVNKGYEYPNDGLVIENSKYQLAIRVGGWKEECMRSYVTGYDENIGAYGNAMKVLIKPVMFGGSTKKQVSVTNLQYILDYNLQIGAPIAFDNRSMTTAVLNTTKTEELQEQYADRFDQYRQEIDEMSV